MAVKKVSTRSMLGGTDHVDWSSLGPSNMPVLTPQQSQTADGAWYFLLQPAHLIRKRQGTDPAATWVGNFAQDEAVLATARDPNPVKIRFANPVRGTGAQFQPADLPAGGTIRFSAFIVARDTQGNEIGSFDRDGVSTNKNDGKAIFLGVLSDDANIMTIELRAELADHPGQTTDFGINRLSIARLSAAPAV